MSLVCIKKPAETLEYTVGQICVNKVISFFANGFVSSVWIQIYPNSRYLHWIFCDIWFAGSQVQLSVKSHRNMQPLDFCCAFGMLRKASHEYIQMQLQERQMAKQQAREEELESTRPVLEENLLGIFVAVPEILKLRHGDHEPKMRCRHWTMKTTCGAPQTEMASKIMGISLNRKPWLSHGISIGSQALGASESSRWTTGSKRTGEIFPDIWDMWPFHFLLVSCVFQHVFSFFIWDDKPKFTTIIFFK